MANGRTPVTRWAFRRESSPSASERHPSSGPKRVARCHCREIESRGSEPREATPQGRRQKAEAIPPEVFPRLASGLSGNAASLRGREQTQRKRHGKPTRPLTELRDVGVLPVTLSGEFSTGAIWGSSAGRASHC